MLSHIPIATRIRQITVSEFAKKHPVAAEQAIRELEAELAASMKQVSSVRDHVWSIVDISNMTPASHLQTSHSV